jgi:hypothetical protein
MTSGSMSARVSVRSVRRRALAALAAVVAALLLVAATASADTPFGGDPTQAVTPGLSCQAGAPPYFSGSASCTWTWTRANVGSDIVPLPVTGGSGVVTSVTLPAMPSPGPMQAVVLTAALVASSNPGIPDYVCCQVKAISPTFTVPPNQVTTVPLELPVSSTAEANLSNPGEASFGDEMAISVLSPTASLPLLKTGATGLYGEPTDAAFAYFPAPTTTSGEFRQLTDPGGYQLLARFNLGAAPTPTPAPAPAPTPAPAPAAKGPAAKKGVDLGGTTLRPAANGKTLNLGKATNPPTATTTQTLTLPTAGAARAGKAPKPLVLGSAKTSVPSGKTVPLKVPLNAKGRAALASRYSLKATLTVVATNSAGESQTVTKTVTVKSARPKRK